MRFKEYTRVSSYNWGQCYFYINNKDKNLFFLLTGDPGRETLDPDLLGEMVKTEWGSNLLDQIFNLIARYLRKVHSDEHIRKVLMHYNAGRSFLDIIGPSDTAYIVSIFMNSNGMWNQDIWMWEFGEEAK